MKTNNCINLLLIGFGPHSKRIYYPILELSTDDTYLNLCAAVELESSRASVETFLSDKHLRPEMVYVDDNQCQFEKLHDSVVIALNSIVKKYEINGVIIATEPLAHLSYAKWALESGLSILMDKPISSYEGVSTSVAMSKKIAQDYYELNDMYQRQRATHPNLVFSLMAQRRYQTSFNLIKERIDECFKITNCPVTNVQTFHSDGQWRMPTEIVEQHYHPYNQGYGKCSHSGYHYFDIIPYVLESGLGDSKCYDNVDVFSQAVRPADVLEQFNLDDYRHLFGTDIFNKHNKYEKDDLARYFKEYGEIDCNSNIAFKKGKQIITSVSVNLTHNGYSQRNWVTAQGRDLYKGNGRVSHESHIFQQGPFQTIHFHSYKSDESANGQDRVGTKEHLEIYIFRNHKMLGGKHVEQFNIDDLISMEGGRKGLVGKSKAKAFYEFIAGMRGEISAENMRSDFSKHEAGSILISAIYQSICHRFLGLDALIQKPLNMDGRREQHNQNDKTIMVA
ncbi:hypothetical protein [Aeromonas sp. MR16]|uniref:hypothetical protein n=1 Tax=Aeromonas sp. MR16 TaxID=2923420 RepID=UPI001F4B3142|nr:hypothetical protein [Aeromonas sp. MR16]MCH7373590.1 hypothetical protein [Aeromonas sp. MR16]